MKEELRDFLGRVNHARYQGQAEGHYESFFLRANHPQRPLAFWIRYTIFSPRGKPEGAMGELWAIFFNGETNRHTAVKKELPFSDCLFDRAGFDVRVGQSRLTEHSLSGEVSSGAGTISWDLGFDGEARPLLLLPFMLYRTKLPAAKSLVGLPMARFNGHLQVNGQAFDISDWIGSQNHNWGSKHTDLYAWGQVAGFDSHPDSFLEVATARIRIGPLWTPAFTPVVLRHGGMEYPLNGPLRLVRAKGAFDYFSWKFRSETSLVSLAGTISAPRDAFVGLSYRNPPGGTKYCLNTKIGSCIVHFSDHGRGIHETLHAKNRAAFEILTDDEGHGIPIAV